jgi:hypothetical protein
MNIRGTSTRSLFSGQSRVSEPGKLKFKLFDCAENALHPSNLSGLASDFLPQELSD